MVTTNPAKVEDAPAHLVKMVRELQSDRNNTQQNMWFIMKSLRLLGLMPEPQLLQVNRLLKNGAFADAALVVRPPGWVIASIVERAEEYHVILATETRTEAGVGFTLGSALLVAFVKAYLYERTPL